MGPSDRIKRETIQKGGDDNKELSVANKPSQVVKSKATVVKHCASPGSQSTKDGGGGVAAVIEPKKTLADRKTTIRLGTLVWAKLDKWPWWPGNYNLINV